MSETKDYSTATNPNEQLAQFEDEIKQLERQIDPLGKEHQDIVNKAIEDSSSLTSQDKQRKIELEREIKPLREQLEEKRSQAREAGKTIRASSGKPAWQGQGE